MNTEPGEKEDYLRGMLERTALYFDKSDLDKLSEITVAIAGFGGVGAITAELLARWGIMKYRLLDMDRYEYSNLNRQLFATSRTLGRRKTEVAAERIREINPYAEIEMTVSERVSNENVYEFVRRADIVIQNADHPSCKLFYIAARKHKVPLVNGYASLTGGRVQTFDFRNSPCRSVFDGLWNRLKFGDSKSLEEMTSQEIADFDREHVHATAPSINFVTNMVGCMIVAEAVKLLTEKGKVVEYPRYLEFDVFSFRMRVRNSNSPLNRQNVKQLWRAVKNRNRAV
ncbi:MAG: ThiF family adenylyltransferase [Candidatus Hodarchaeota archaeon]